MALGWPLLSRAISGNAAPDRSGRAHPPDCIEVQGYRGLANLAVAIEHDLTRRRQSVTHTSIEEDAVALTV
jgi:hypothetical protein